METPPLHVLLALDAQILGGEVYDNTSPTPSVTAGEDISTSGMTGHDGDDDEDLSPESPARGDEGDGSTLTTTSRFWGVCWNRLDKKWQAYSCRARRTSAAAKSPPRRRRAPATPKGS